MLIACAFLGILLYVVLGIVERAQEPVVAPGRGPGPRATERLPGPDRPSVEQDADIPAIGSHAAVLSMLSEAGLNADYVLAASRGWRQERGFLGTDELLGVSPAEAPIFSYQSLDAEALDAMAQTGDVGALQALAAQNLLVDPFLATDLYSRAAAEGSEFALLQIASLLETFSSVSPADADVAFDYARKLARLRASQRAGGLLENAFAFALAALRGGGAPVARPDVLSWIQHMGSDFDRDALNDACDLSARIFFEISAIRRERGKLRLSRQPPPLFFSAADLAEQMPCRDTRTPIEPVLDIGACEVRRVQHTRHGTLDLYICP